MFYIGCHLSSSKGFLAMGKEALSIGANTFQFFTRNPRGGNAKPIDVKDMEEYNLFAKNNNFGSIVAHAPYTMNACAKDKGLRDFAKNMMEDDLNRLQHIRNVMYNFHPGSHVSQGVDVGTNFICQMLNDVLNPKISTLVLLETMSGKGSEIGRTFEEIQQIISNINLKEKVGVCLDTCHIYDAGYDIINNLDNILENFDKTIGLNKLKAIHLNDTMNPFESHKDRHQKIGEGYIGLTTFSKIINHSKLRNLPFILETPNELEGYKQEISTLRNLYQD